MLCLLVGLGMFTCTQHKHEYDRIVALTLEELKRQELEDERGETVVPQQPASAKRFCNYCGTPLIEGNAYCTSCGHKTE